MLCDIHFRYDDDHSIHPFVINCPLKDVGKFTKRIANKRCVAQVFINIHPGSPICHFIEFSL